jgi:4-alpha-glucanotransferase
MASNTLPFPRSSGILLHITSLPGVYGIGDIGPEAYAFVDRLAEAGQQYWQVLPLGPTGFADSPYQCLSTFAGNTNLISLDDLHDWLPRHALEDIPVFRRRRVEYEMVIPWHDEMLSLAYEGFLAQGGKEETGFVSFCKDNASWLDDFALFMALKEAHHQRPWTEWPKGAALRAPIELEAAREKHISRVEEHRFRQWVFYTQWRALRKHAQERNIRIIGDIPIYVAHDSCDVWVNRHLFDLDETGHPRVVAGVPPDYFSPTGQLWGNPLYLWTEHRKKNYAWWTTRVQVALDLFDIIRIDHFRGLYDYWQVPAAAPTALDGTWMDGPRDDFFDALKAALREQSGRDVREIIIAEDLGDNMAKVRKWCDSLGLAGMKILQFAFGDNQEERERFRPKPYDGINDDLSIMYTGTHDNNTAMGWWYTEARERHRNEVVAFVRDWRQLPDYDVTEPNWEMIRIGMESRERVLIMPLQDILGAGSSSRMNRPGVTAGNWRWRYTREELAEELWKRVAELTRQSGRFHER